MTFYELTQAMVRRRRFVTVAGLVVLLLAAASSFKIDNGLAWRSGEKWEAGVQIAVVSQGNESLANAETRSEHLEAAAVYAGLLQTNEAATAIGEANELVLDEPVSAVVETGSSLITATLIAPTEEKARSAALSIFDYLRDRLDTPLTASGNLPTATTIPTVQLSGPFDSEMTLSLDPDLADVSDELFVRVDSEVGSALVIPVARSAGQTVTVETTLAPVMTIVLSLQDATGSELDTLRLAPPAVDGHSAYYPILTLDLERGAIVPSAGVDAEESWQINQSGVVIAWLPGAPAVSVEGPSVVPVDIALATTDPVPIMVGGRRGPILLGVVVVLGAILILTSVVVAEAWNKERAADPYSIREPDAQEVGQVHQLGSREPMRVDRENP